MVVYAGFFSDLGKAQAIQKALTDKNYTDGEVLLIEPTTTGDDLKKTISRAKNREFLTKAMSDNVSARIEKGDALLVVKTRLGDGLFVEGMFADGGERLPTYWGPKAKTFSEIIGFPTLTPSRTTDKGPPVANKPLTQMIAPCIIEKRGSPSSSMGVPLTMKPLVTGSFMPMLLKPLTTGMVMPLLYKRKSK